MTSFPDINSLRTGASMIGRDMQDSELSKSSMDSAAIVRRKLLQTFAMGTAAAVLQGCSGGSESTSSTSSSSGTVSSSSSAVSSSSSSVATSSSSSSSSSSTSSSNPSSSSSSSSSSNSSSSASSQQNRAPVWGTIPALTFTRGVAGTISIAGYVSDADGDALSVAMNAVTLPTGVTFDAANKVFRYDGGGTVASVSGIVLTANDGRA